MSITTKLPSVLAVLVLGLLNSGQAKAYWTASDLYYDEYSDELSGFALSARSYWWEDYDSFCLDYNYDADRCETTAFYYGSPAVDSTQTYPDNSYSTAYAEGYDFALIVVGLPGPPVGGLSLDSSHVVKQRWCLLEWWGGWFCISVDTWPLPGSSRGAQKFPTIPVPSNVCGGNLYACQTAEQLSGFVNLVILPIVNKARPGQTATIVMESDNSTAEVVYRGYPQSPGLSFRVVKGSHKDSQGNARSNPSIDTCDRINFVLDCG